MRERIKIVLMFSIFSIAFLLVLGFSYFAGKEKASIPLENKFPSLRIPSEAGVFQRSDQALNYADMPIDENHQRSMATYYDNRAYPGAPPSIPHAVEDERNMGGNSCLKCHENGGFVNKFDAYAPVTPHPEYTNCRQCHVAQKSQDLFKASNFERGTIPSFGNNNALEGSPPAIPHTLQLRENCLACHAGPSAPKEIRVTHPERVNCRQCHVSHKKIPGDFGTFTRKAKSDE